ncbi:hypothetical protein HY413_00560 [Candidatus Kaiserbacteria bacterium]|nr:hypothetical protein [Candidatus Kaiserbacteria bacterium]
MAEGILRGLRAGIVFYLIVSIGIDHFLLQIPWQHVFTDPLTIGATVIIGLIVAICKRRK